jgi:CheY-like chemotaxis protein
METPVTQVLTVDDSDTTRQLMRAMLEPAGYAVIEAEDGLQALQALRAATRPGVVLLDYQMPNMDGGELLQVVAREGAPLSEHEYIIISAHTGTFPPDLIDLLRQLSIRIFPKPFEREMLLTVVAQAVERLNAPPDESAPSASES